MLKENNIYYTVDEKIQETESQDNEFCHVGSLIAINEVLKKNSVSLDKGNLGDSDSQMAIHWR